MKTNLAHKVRSPVQVRSCGLSWPNATTQSDLPKSVLARLRNPSTRSAAFSLIEVIGVMAIALIVALAFALTTTKSLDTTFATQEAALLQRFATALQNNISRYHVIPGTNNWYQAVAAELGVSPNMVAFTDRNPFSTRLFMVDPGSKVNGTNVFDGYNQTIDGAGATQPYYRAMIASSLSTASALSLVGGTSFTNLWNSADSALPSDLKIQRINLSPLFFNLRLNNVQPTSTNGQFKIDGNGPNNVPASGGICNGSYYLPNSLVSLMEPVGGTTNAELLLTRDSSFFFVGNYWRSVPYVPDYTASATQTNAIDADLAKMFATAAAMFSSSPLNTNALSGATPISVLNSMSNFMYFYTPYATYAAAYAATNGGTWPTTGILYSNADNAQTAVYNAMNNLASGIVQGGCR